MFLSDSIGIDTEILMGMGESFYSGWLGIGRFGLVLLKKLTDTTVFNPYLTGVAVLVLLPCVCLLWIKLFEHITKKENHVGAVLFSMTLIASVILTEQLYFKLQAMEVCIGFCMIPIALYLIYEAAAPQITRLRKIIYLLSAAAMLIVTFGIYQVMVAQFIFGAAAVLYLESYFGNQNCKRLTIAYAAVFAAAFGLNQAIVAVFFSSGSSYLSGQIAWSTQGIGACVLNIVKHAAKVLVGSQIDYAKTFSVYVICMIGMTLYLTTHVRKSIYGVVSMLFVFGGPFYMTVLCGQEPVARSQLVYPFVLSFLSYACFLISEKNKWYYYLILAAGALTVFLQLKYTMMLNYTDSVRYEQDVVTGNQLIEKIENIQTEETSYPIVCYGAYSAKLNNSCVRGGEIGYSLFEWDADAEPVGYFGTRRVINFLHVLGGVEYTQPDTETTERLLETAKDMPCWPEEGSVALYDGVIVVKLGEIGE